MKKNQEASGAAEEIEKAGQETAAEEALENKQESVLDRNAEDTLEDEKNDKAAGEEREKQRIREKIEAGKKQEQENIDYGSKSEEEILHEIDTEEHTTEQMVTMLKALKEKEYKFGIKGRRNKLSQDMVDHDSTKDKRDNFLTDIVGAIEQARIDGRIKPEFWAGFKRLVSIGSGHGENPYGIMKAFMGEGSEAVLIDPGAAPSQEIANDPSVMHLGRRFEDVKMVAGDGEKNIVESSNFLQLYEKGEKIEMLKKMIRIAGDGGRLIIVDEIKRPVPGGIKDYVLNRSYNMFQGKYVRMSAKEYEDMFDDLKLKRLTSAETDNYTRGSVLYMLEVTPEALQMATAKG